MNVLRMTLEDGRAVVVATAEVVRVVFDPARVSFEKLLGLFWEGHDPTQGMRQGNDVGTQYRSGIYAHDAAQRDAEFGLEPLSHRLVARHLHRDGAHALVVQPAAERVAAAGQQQRQHQRRARVGDRHWPSPVRPASRSRASMHCGVPSNSGVAARSRWMRRPSSLPSRW